MQLRSATAALLLIIGLSAGWAAFLASLPLRVPTHPDPRVLLVWIDHDRTMIGPHSFATADACLNVARAMGLPDTHRTGFCVTVTDGMLKK